MAKPTFDLLSFVICDDIRREESKKNTLVGVYSGTIIVPANLFWPSSAMGVPASPSERNSETVVIVKFFIGR